MASRLPEVAVKVDGHEAMVSMVALGSGVAVVPEPVINHSPVRDRVRILDISYPFQPFELGVCMLGKKLEQPLLQAFWQLAAAKK